VKGGPPPESERPPAPGALAALRRALRKNVGARTPIELQLVGRVLLHAAVVGALAGAAGCIFFAGVEAVERLVLASVCGYVALRAGGEEPIRVDDLAPFRPWLLWLVPALGALASGALSARFAPETRGGGTDATIRAFHHEGGVVRTRVPIIKAAASILTLGTGGSGGREGPTMQIGGAIGSIVARYLKVTDRERRLLLVAGTAAGMAAVFRTPLGAALLAVEVLHRDDFESDALVPAVLASVVGYSVFVSVFGEHTLFAHAAHYPFVPSQLPLYALLAVFVSLGATVFLGTMQRVKRFFEKLSVPGWCKPGLGGLALGLGAVPLLVALAPHLPRAGQGLGILGGGYGAGQVAITGAPWFAEGWRGVQLLLALAALKMIATSLTVGSGGSAGDFGPSLVIGGLLGGAFGRAAQLVLGDPRIDPGAFALVGMGTFYGGIAHVPIASLVMVCELAGSYELLVPLMLCEGIAFVALRKKSLYHSQVMTKRDSPAHRDDLIMDVLRGLRIGDVVVRDRDYVTFSPKTSGSDVMRAIARQTSQHSFPVVREDGAVVGVITSDILRATAAEPEIHELAIAHDMMAHATTVTEDEDLHTALERLVASGLHELVVLGPRGEIVGFIAEAEISRVYTAQTQRDEPPASSPRPSTRA
jgi:CIC family chloride channel protein